MPDPRWLEVLKASGLQTGAIAVACALFLFAARWAWLPPLDAWMVHAAVFGLLLFGCLAFASFISATFKFFPIQMWVIHRVKTNKRKREVRDYIPHMTVQEKTIISYLLEKNQMMFTAENDGGQAATLISRGIVVYAIRPGQNYDNMNVPMAIPDHVWEVLVEYKDQFPYVQPKRGEPEKHPWRVGWMAR